MAINADTVDAVTVSRVSRNLDVLRRFTLRVVHNPSLVNEIPTGHDLVFISDDDPELADPNRHGDRRMVREGQDSTFRPVHAAEVPKERLSR